MFCAVRIELISEFICLGRTGRTVEAEVILRDLEQRVEHGESRHVDLALVQLGMGLPKAALASLERGFARRDDGILFLGLEQRFEALHSEARFRSLLRELKAVTERSSR